MGTKPGAVGSVTPPGQAPKGAQMGALTSPGPQLGVQPPGQMLTPSGQKLGGTSMQTPPQMPKAAPKPQPKPKPPTVPQHNVARTIQILGQPGDYQQMMKGFASGATPQTQARWATLAQQLSAPSSSGSQPTREYGNQ